MSDVLRRVGPGGRFARDGCAFHAQSVAFNAIFALFPLSVLTLSVVTYVLPESAASRACIFQYARADASRLHRHESRDVYLRARHFEPHRACLPVLVGKKSLHGSSLRARSRAQRTERASPRSQLGALADHASRYVRAADRRRRAAGRSLPYVSRYRHPRSAARDAHSRLTFSRLRSSLSSRSCSIAGCRTGKYRGGSPCAALR